MSSYIRVTIEILDLRLTKEISLWADSKIDKVLEGLGEKYFNAHNKITLYAWIVGQDRPLNPKKTVKESGLMGGEVLQVGLRPPVIQPQPLQSGFLENSQSQYLSNAGIILHDERLNERYMLDWMPIVLGRRNSNSAYPRLQRIIIQEAFYHDDALKVSRDHAVIMKHPDQQKNSFYLVPVAEQRQNYTYLNNSELAFFQIYQIRPGDQIQLGDTKIILTFHIR